MLISMNSSIIIPVALASLWLFSMYMYAITSLLMLLCGCYDMYVVSQEPCVCVCVCVCVRTCAHVWHACHGDNNWIAFVSTEAGKCWHVAKDLFVDEAVMNAWSVLLLCWSKLQWWCCACYDWSIVYVGSWESMWRNKSTTCFSLVLWFWSLYSCCGNMRTPSTCRSSLEASGLACYVWGCHLLALYVRTAWGGVYTGYYRRMGSCDDYAYMYTCGHVCLCMSL